jgi:hypothetical protein
VPQEIRHILFSREEVSSAITLYKQHRGELFVHHSVRMAATRNEPHVAVRVLDEDGNESWIGGSALAAALIRSCIKERIPLPASAHKMIRALPDGIALILIGGTSSDHVQEALAAVAACSGPSVRPARPAYLPACPHATQIGRVR